VTKAIPNMKMQNATVRQRLLCMTSLLALSCAASTQPTVNESPKRGYTETVVDYASENQFRLLRDDAKSSREPSAISSGGGGMLICVMFFGMLSLLGFALYQIV